MKAIPQPRWVDGVPGWERREVKRHYNPADRTLDSDFLPEPLPLEEARERRRTGEPLEYLLGHCHVDEMTLEVDGSVLVPRPETETLLRRFRDRLDDLPAGPIVDCGTGSGLLAVGLARRTDRTTVATDRFRNALAVARRNASRNGAGQVLFVQSDRLSSLRSGLAGIVANLPYVLPGSNRLQEAVRDYEPHEALFVPDDPRTFYGTFVRQALDRLREGGELWMEVDEQLLDAVSFESIPDGSRGSVDVLEDDFGNPRFVVVSRL